MNMRNSLVQQALLDNWNFCVILFYFVGELEGFAGTLLKLVYEGVYSYSAYHS